MNDNKFAFYDGIWLSLSVGYVCFIDSSVD